ncbi:MAG: hypothetical protein JST58_14760 [Bacteroidetes bacterium]|nr:hypothetical protein [Bacteroidota bacterium]
MRKFLRMHAMAYRYAIDDLVHGGGYAYLENRPQNNPSPPIPSSIEAQILGSHTVRFGLPMIATPFMEGLNNS